MSYQKKFKMSESERRRRTFSESFKRAKVLELEQGKTKVNEICRVYELSTSTVHRWVNKYSKTQKPARLVVEADSDSKKLLELKKKIAELERVIGQKQIMIDFQSKMIELAEEEYGVDIKKKCSLPPSNISEK